MKYCSAAEVSWPTNVVKKKQKQKIDNDCEGITNSTNSFIKISFSFWTAPVVSGEVTREFISYTLSLYFISPELSFMWPVSDDGGG